MYLPDEIIRAFSMMSDQDCGALLKATIAFIDKNSDISEMSENQETAEPELSPAAEAAFTLAKIILTPRLKRKRARLARKAKRASESTNKAHNAKTESSNSEPSVRDKAPCKHDELDTSDKPGSYAEPPTPATHSLHPTSGRTGSVSRSFDPGGRRW